MSRHNRRPSGRASGRRHLSKAMLLPMSRQAAEEISLANHLALAVCRKDQGSAHLLNELVKAAYLSYYVRAAGFGDAPVDLYRRGEAALEAAGARAIGDAVWGISADGALVLEEILAVYHRQLASAPLWTVADAEDRLTRFVQSECRSPIRVDADVAPTNHDLGFNSSSTPRPLR
jgi:hypothetical protein